jgi:hypothetical protein
LRAATETIREYGGCARQRPYGGEKHALTDRLRDRIVRALEPEVAGQAATTDDRSTGGEVCLRTARERLRTRRAFFSWPVDKHEQITEIDEAAAIWSDAVTTTAAG